MRLVLDQAGPRRPAGLQRQVDLRAQPGNQVEGPTCKPAVPEAKQPARPLQDALIGREGVAQRRFHPVPVLMLDHPSAGNARRKAPEVDVEAKSVARGKAALELGAIAQERPSRITIDGGGLGRNGGEPGVVDRPTGRRGKAPAPGFQDRQQPLEAEPGRLDPGIGTARIGLDVDRDDEGLDAPR